MRLADQFPATGEVLFRWPGYLLPAFVPVFLARLIGRAQESGLAWEIGCFSSSVIGLALRLVTVGASPDGTSGRNTREQKAVVLNTTGPYSIVRHPLYLGN